MYFKNTKKFGIFQKTVKVVYKYNECLIKGDSNPVKKVFYPEVSTYGYAAAR